MSIIFGGGVVTLDRTGPNGQSSIRHPEGRHMARAERLDFQQSLGVGLDASPALVLFMRMLSLSRAEIEAEIQNELASSPALELDDRRTLPPRLAAPAEPAAGEDPIQELVSDIAPLLNDRADRMLLEYLTGNLDEHGLLVESLDDIATRLGTTRGCVDRVVALLREHGPPGIAARDVKECLLLQVDRVEIDDAHRLLARRLIEHHLPEIAGGRLGAVCRATGADRAAVDDAVNIIRKQLRPYPLSRGETERPLVPDVIVEEREDGTFDVRLSETSYLAVRVSPTYVHAVDDSSLAPEERRAVRDQVARASGFVRRLEHRWSTMLAVARVVVDEQSAFVRGTIADLKPLTRAAIANRLGVHKSTVGRAVTHRSILLPRGDVVPLDTFFTPWLAPHEALRQIVLHEKHPHPDSEIAAMLQLRGYPVARRTVAKYRQALGIPPPRLR
ncbi:MAG TPA: hypothetical protein VM784_01775 [Actinomycetota bacterium]|nr:hypothetical protein [Actinomycetota bacterium]